MINLKSGILASSIALFLSACGSGSSSNTSNSNNANSVNIINSLGECYSSSGEFYALEEWNTQTSTKRLKKLCLRTDNSGVKHLEIIQRKYSSGSWSTYSGSSDSTTYLNNGVDSVLVDMSNLNNISPFRQFPAILDNSSANPIFTVGVLKYKLNITATNISGQSGSSLDTGPTVSNILSSVTFNSGAKLYRATASLMPGDYYIVKQRVKFSGNSHSLDSANDTRDYRVYNFGSVGGANFNAKSSAGNPIDNALSSGSGDAVVNYQDSNNFLLFSITTPYNASGTNTLTAKEYVNGSVNASATIPYTKEIHSSKSFIVISYQGREYFIGNISSIDSSYLVYGEKKIVTSSSPEIALTENSIDNGDFLDDVMVNKSAKDDILNENSINIENNF